MVVSVLGRHVPTFWDLPRAGARATRDTSRRRGDLRGGTKAKGSLNGHLQASSGSALQVRTTHERGCRPAAVEERPGRGGGRGRGARVVLPRDGAGGAGRPGSHLRHRRQSDHRLRRLRPGLRSSGAARRRQDRRRRPCGRQLRAGPLQPRRQPGHHIRHRRQSDHRLRRHRRGFRGGGPARRQHRGRRPQQLDREQLRAGPL